MVGKILYSVGSDGSILAQDVVTRQARIASPASARPFAGGGGAVVVHKSKLILFGGTGDAAGKVQIFDTLRNRWKIGRAMPFAASGSAVTVLNGKAYLLGGHVDGQASRAAARYDLSKGRWKLLPDLILPRSGAYADADRDNLYLGAGQTTNAAGQLEAVTDDSQQILNLKTLTWTAYGVLGSPTHPPTRVGG